MTGRQANCPSCGALVEFKAGSSLLAICGHCENAVARVGDDIGELEILGKVAPLANVASPLSLGLDGRFRGKSFTLVGRLQLDYGLGPWNEWYAIFDDGRSAWIAEAQGRVYVLFGKTLEGLPPYSHWRVGTKFQIGGKRFSVSERRKARFISAEGELPFAVPPGSEVRYCDIEGEDGAFGTLDFGTGEELESVYVGSEAQYLDLFRKSDLKDLPTEALSVGLNCPNCGSAVGIKAPDEAQRVTCPSCDSILDCNKGQPLYLLSSAKRQGPPPLIPLGTKGVFRGKKWEVYGHMVRSVNYYGVEYPWDEYLLRGEDRSWRWLVESEGHYSWIEPVPAGAVMGEFEPVVRGMSFNPFQSASAKVKSIRGEFYWKVGVGDVASTRDFVHPPYVLSKEVTSEEETWSLGTYVPVDEIERAFMKGKTLPRPSNVAPNQPNPWADARSQTLKLAALATVALLLFASVVSSRSYGTQVYEGLHTFDAKAQPENQVVISEAFQIDRTSNLEIDLEANVVNSWFALSGSLISESDDSVRSFDVEVGYYRGVMSGESWSEGSPRDSVYLGSIPPGSYVLRLQPSADNTGYKLSGANQLQFANRYSVSARSNVFFPSHAFFVGFLLWIFPVIIFALYSGFEKRRWEQSDYGDDE